MKFNSTTGSLKGHTFDPNIPDSMPGFTKSMNREAQQAWAEKETQRYQVVRECSICSEPLIAEEVTAHILNHAAGHLRPLARMVADLSKEDRAELNRIVKVVTK